jgi:ABC-type transporter Mla MlaB component
MATPVEFSVDGPIARSQVPGLMASLCAMLESTQASTVVCQLQGVQANGIALDALARLRLLAARHGCAMRLAGASEGLLELIAFAGLDDVLRV